MAKICIHGHVTPKDSAVVCGICYTEFFQTVSPLEQYLLNTITALQADVKALQIHTTNCRKNDYIY